jgi:microcin C transport system permease protein
MFKKVGLYILILLSMSVLLSTIFPLWVLGDGQSHPVAPSSVYWLGTTADGKNILVVLSYSIILVFLFLILAVAIVFCLAILIGVSFDYYRSFSNWVPLERVIEILNGVPSLMLLVILSYYQWISWGSFLGILIIFKWTYTAQIAQGICSEISQRSYIKEAKALGFSDFSIFRYYLFPPVFQALLPKLSVVGISILNYITILEFLGYPLLSDAASLGMLIADGKEHLYAPWILISGIIGVLLVLIPFVMIGGIYSTHDTKEKGLI